VWRFAVGTTGRRLYSTGLNGRSRGGDRCSPSPQRRRYRNQLRAGRWQYPENLPDGSVARRLLSTSKPRFCDRLAAARQSGNRTSCRQSDGSGLLLPCCSEQMTCLHPCQISWPQKSTVQWPGEPGLQWIRAESDSTFADGPTRWLTCLSGGRANLKIIRVADQVCRWFASLTVPGCAPRIPPGPRRASTPD
jgi:hypothetical protein